MADSEGCSVVNVPAKHVETARKGRLLHISIHCDDCCECGGCGCRRECNYGLEIGRQGDV